MPLTITCQCGASLKVKDELAGKRVACPKCGSAVSVPQASQPASQQPAAQQPAAPSAGAPIVVNCACGKQLRVKQEYLGKRVKCPACQQPLDVRANEAPVASPNPAAPQPAASSPPDLFAGFDNNNSAPAANDPFGGGAPPAANDPFGGGASSAANDPFGGGTPPAANAPFGGGPSGPNPYNQGGGAYSDPSPYASPTGTAVAQTRSGGTAYITAPGIAMMVIAAISVIIIIPSGIFQIMLAADLPMNGPEATGRFVGMIVGLIVMPIGCGFISYGGLCMVRRKNWGMALTGAIFCMLPCTFLCFSGFPFGLWALIVLCLGDTRRAFA